MDVMDFYHVNDRRRHRRFSVVLPARLYHPDGRFSLCWTADLSLEGAAVHLTGDGPEQVTAFGCDETGKLGVAHCRFAGPFMRLAFEATSQTHALIKRALHALGDQKMIQPLPARRGERLSTRNVMLTRADGSHLICDILDMSSQGMLLCSHMRPPLGERVVLGKVAGQVVRHLNNGFAIRIEEQAPSNVVRFPASYRQPSQASSPSFNDIA